MAAVVAVAVRLGRQLPSADVRKVAEALLAPHGLSTLRATAPMQIAAACTELSKLHLDEVSRPVAAGALLGALEPDPEFTSITPVWSGPETAAANRLTSAVVVDLIGQAREHVLLVGYAVFNEPSVAAALHAASARGVTVTLILESASDNPKFHGGSEPFPGLDATRLHWPAGIRPQGASLHAKVLVIDCDSALVGSANITGAALEKNLECGILLHGGIAPLRIRDHVAFLVESKQLQGL